jgi:hypothetical protein
MKFEKFVNDEDLRLCQIFISDETGLNYKMNKKKKKLASKLDSVVKENEVKNQRITLHPRS